MSSPCFGGRRIALGIALAGAAAAPAWGHAYVDSSSPADAVSGPAPREVVIRFTENVELEFSAIVVKGPTGETVSVGPVRQPAPNTLAVDVKPLPAGSYTVQWRVLSVDTHITEGALHFAVAPGALRGP
ncbi:MAG TPA: copper resistance CopC family protein [Candidatus Methylomirabilis sp.]|nr:copper resistance CopC family protein [Candidatus Methylomirabilis sp.]